MNDAPSISVIIPVYNVEKYLDACLDSVFAQDFESFEVICVDDGSTDSSPEILARRAAQHPNLRVIRKPNGGLSSARNAAMPAARGKYILFVDSDDALLGSDSLRGMFRRAEETRADLVFFNSEIAYETEALAAANHNARDYLRRRGGYADGISGQKLFIRQMERNEYHAGVFLNLYRREFLEAHGLRFPEGYLFEDQLFTLQCLTLAQRTAQYEHSCYLYNIREGSIMTGTARARIVRDHYRIAAKLEEFYRGIGPAEPAFRRCYRRWVHEMCRLGTSALKTLPPSQRSAALEGLTPAELRLARADRARDPFRRAHKKLRRALSRAKRAFLRK